LAATLLLYIIAEQYWCTIAFKVAALAGYERVHAAGSEHTRTALLIKLQAETVPIMKSMTSGSFLNLLIGHEVND
jgi:hypothetical protein